MSMKWIAIAGLMCLSCRTVSEEPIEITVLSYNIRHGLGEDGKVDIGRAAALIRRVNPDLVALQEIDHRVGRSGSIDQMTELERQTGMHARFGMFMPYGGGEYGMGLLSRFPIVESTNHRLPNGTEPRSALEARVRLPNQQELLFCGVHLYATETQRLAQAKMLVQIHRDTTLPMILAGDFNSRPNSPVMKLIGRHWTNAEKREDRLTFSSTKPDREIDYILFRPSDRFRVVSIDVLDEPLVSDHRPVVAVLKLLATPREAASNPAALR